jgi:hypothetical protein
MAVETGDTDLVLQRFLRLEAQPAQCPIACQRVNRLGSKRF